ncbi:MAG: HTTM domain-containing protein [Bacteroidota bacterium]
MLNPLRTFRKRLFEQVDISTLVFFRIAFGGILFWEVCRYFYYGWIERYWIAPDFYFTYQGFGWVAPWEGNMMYVHFLVLGVLALFIMIGFMYRISTFLFFLGFSYVFLLDKSNYLNHFYLISLLSFLMVLVPAHRSLSIDAKLFPSMASEKVPQWALWIIAFQVGVAYFYGGIAKLNADWLAGEPMRKWLGDSTDFPLVGQYFTEDLMPYVFSYGGLLFDLLVVPMLLFKRTRWLAFGAIAFFHLSNSRLFNIGIFPWFMLATSGLFFAPDWFRRFVNFIFPGTWPAAVQQVATQPTIIRPKPSSFRPQLIYVFLGVYVFFQLVFPFRHLAIPGNVSWTEEGHRFAWHMKLRDKQARARFIVTDPATQKEWVVKPKKYLSKRQARKMKTRPDMILQFSHYLAEIYERKGYPNVTIKALVLAELNSREEQLLIDPEVDLAKVTYNRMPAPWIMPLLDKKSNQASLTENAEEQDE